MATPSSPALPYRSARARVLPGTLVRAQLHASEGRVMARAYADSARIAYEEAIRLTPNEAQQHALLGVALALQGRKEQAVLAAERGTELLPIAEDGYFGPYLELQLAPPTARLVESE